MNNQEREKLKSTKKGFLILDRYLGYWLNVNGNGNGYTLEQSKAGVFSPEFISRCRLRDYHSLTITELK